MRVVCQIRLSYWYHNVLLVAMLYICGPFVSEIEFKDKQHNTNKNSGYIFNLIKQDSASLEIIELDALYSKPTHYGTTTNLSISHSSLSIHKIFSFTADKCHLLASKVLNRI